MQLSAERHTYLGIGDNLSKIMQCKYVGNFRQGASQPVYDRSAAKT